LFEELARKSIDNSASLDEYFAIQPDEFAAAAIVTGRFKTSQGWALQNQPVT
jgi:hypothetical protein